MYVTPCSGITFGDNCTSVLQVALPSKLETDTVTILISNVNRLVTLISTVQTPDLLKDVQVFANVGSSIMDTFNTTPAYVL